MRLRYIKENEAAISMVDGEYLFSVSEIARMLHCHRQTISKIILDHKIESKGMRKTYKLYSIHDVVKKKYCRRNWWY